MKLKYLLKLMLVAWVMLSACSEDEILSSQKTATSIYMIRKSTVDKINIEENTLTKDIFSLSLNAEKAAKNSKYLVIASSSHSLYEEEIEVFELSAESNFKIDITENLNYSKEAEVFWLNDLYLTEEKIYLIGVKVNYYTNTELVQVVEIDLESKSVSNSTLFKHETVAAPKYIRNMNENKLYFNIGKELLTLDLQDFNRPNNSVINTSFFPGNIILDRDENLTYFDLGLKKTFVIDLDPSTASFEQPLENLTSSILARERPVAQLDNTFIGFYLTNTTPQVGIYQYDYVNQKMIRMVQEEELNKAISENGYFVMEAEFVRTSTNQIIFYGGIFNEEISAHEYILSVLDADFNRIQSHSFDRFSEEVIAIL